MLGYEGDGLLPRELSLWQAAFPPPLHILFRCLDGPNGAFPLRRRATLS